MKNSDFLRSQKWPATQSVKPAKHPFIQCLRYVWPAVFVQQEMVLPTPHGWVLSAFGIRLPNSELEVFPVKELLIILDWTRVVQVNNNVKVTNQFND